MSTEGWPLGATCSRVLGLFGALAVLSCRPGVRTEVSALCEGKGVEGHYTMSVDHVEPRAGDDMQRLIGHKYDLEVGLYSPQHHRRCEDSYGQGRFRAELPSALERYTSRSGAVSWTMDGKTVVANLHPEAVYDNLLLSLPIDGSAPTWSLSTLAGRVAGGSLKAAD